MAQQENGWPLGLQPLNLGTGLVGHSDYSGSISFSTLPTGSPISSTISSSDLDTQSIGSFFHEHSITLGSLIGISSFLDLSGRLGGGSRSDSLRSNKSYKPKTWLFSLCSKASYCNENVRSSPSLGHFLQVERRAVNGYQWNQSPSFYEHGEYSEGHPVLETNSLFVNGHVVPPQSSSWLSLSVGRRHNNRRQGCGCGVRRVPILLSCCISTEAN